MFVCVSTCLYTSDLSLKRLELQLKLGPFTEQFSIWSRSIFSYFISVFFLIYNARVVATQLARQWQQERTSFYKIFWRLIFFSGKDSLKIHWIVLNLVTFNIFIFHIPLKGLVVHLMTHEMYIQTLKNISLFCKRDLWKIAKETCVVKSLDLHLSVYSAKKTFIFNQPINHSQPIQGGENT